MDLSASSSSLTRPRSGAMDKEGKKKAKKAAFLEDVKRKKRAVEDLEFEILRRRDAVDELVDSHKSVRYKQQCSYRLNQWRAEYRALATATDRYRPSDKMSSLRIYGLRDKDMWADEDLRAWYHKDAPSPIRLDSYDFVASGYSLPRPTSTPADRPRGKTPPAQNHFEHLMGHKPNNTPDHMPPAGGMAGVRQGAGGGAAVPHWSDHMNLMQQQRQESLAMCPAPPKVQAPWKDRPFHEELDKGMEFQTQEQLKAREADLYRSGSESMAEVAARKEQKRRMEGSQVFRAGSPVDKALLMTKAEAMEPRPF